MWIDLCKALSTELNDPYLRAMFTLISTNENWNSVLQTEGLSLKDKLGIALRFLNDKEVNTNYYYFCLLNSQSGKILRM